MHTAILTFDGYNELVSLIALGMLNRIKEPGWRVSIASPTPRVTSMNGVTIDAMVGLEEACTADAVIVGSGSKTREAVEDPATTAALAGLDPAQQQHTKQNTGTLVLARRGLLDDGPAG